MADLTDDDRPIAYGSYPYRFHGPSVVDKAKAPQPLKGKKKARPRVAKPLLDDAQTFDDSKDVPTDADPVEVKTKSTTVLARAYRGR